MTSPFETPDATPLAEGELDIAEGVTTALSTISRNAITLFGALILGVLAYYASCCSIIGWIVVIPWLVLGMYHLVLRAVDGHAFVTDLYEHLDYGPDFGRGWILIILYMVVLSPAMFISMFATVAFELAQINTPLLSNGFTHGLMLLFQFLLIRLFMAPFLMVDAGYSPFESFQESIRRTSGSWGRLCLLQLLLWLLNSPVIALQVGMAMLAEQSDDLSFIESAFPFIVGASLVVIVIQIAVAIFTYVVHGELYRQLVPNPNAQEV